MRISVYIITNSITGKSYIGITKNSIHKQFLQHINLAKKNPKKNYWYISLNKYHITNFTISLLETVENEKEAFEKEIYYINKFNTLCSNGYNSTSGGGGCLNPSDEVREKLSLEKL